MRVFLIIGALLGFATAALGIFSMRSDIQIIIAAVGLFAGFGLLGLAAVVGRADQIWRQMKAWSEPSEAE